LKANTQLTLVRAIIELVDCGDISDDEALEAIRLVLPPEEPPPPLYAPPQDAF
jgi:hypothetical protein